MYAVRLDGTNAIETFKAGRLLFTRTGAGGSSYMPVAVECIHWAEEKRMEHKFVWYLKKRKKVALN